MSAQRRAVLGVTLAVASLAAGCGAGSSAEADGTLRVATTVAPITSIVASVAGDRARVTGIVPEGTNSHTYEPRPSAAQVLAEADVIFLNGLRLEEPTLELARANLGDGAEIVQLGDHAITPDEHVYDFSFPREEGKPNPHLWTDPPLVTRYAATVRDVLTARDPQGADVYAANFDAIAARVDALDAAMRAAFATVPPSDRELLTYHDAYAYFARDYGWRVIGAIQVSDFTDPTPQEVVRLIEQVRAEGVPAIFGSEVFPSPVLDQIAREAGVAYYDDLRDDDLPGVPGDPDHSLLALLRFNYATVTRALGGDASALDALDVASGVADRAEYPQ